MSILDPKFKYRPSYDTDVGRHLRKFKREAEQRAAEQREAEQQQQPPFRITKIAHRGGRS